MGRYLLHFFLEGNSGALASCGCHLSLVDSDGGQYIQEATVVLCQKHGDDSVDALIDACIAAEKWMTPVLQGFNVTNIPKSHPVHRVRAAIKKATRHRS